MSEIDWQEPPAKYLGMNDANEVRALIRGLSERPGHWARVEGGSAIHSAAAFLERKGLEARRDGGELYARWPGPNANL